MILDPVIRDVKQSLQKVLEALSNNLKSSHNFAPDGEAGQVLTSNGPNRPPTWQWPSTPP